MACWLTSPRRDAVTQTWREGRRFQEPIRGIWISQCLLKNCAQNWIETCHVSIIILNAGLPGPEWFNSCLHEICTGSTRILLYPIVLFLRSLWMLLPLPHYSSLALSCAAHPDFCKKKKWTVVVAVIWGLSLLWTLALEHGEWFAARCGYVVWSLQAAQLVAGPCCAILCSSFGLFRAWANKSKM